MAGLCDITGAWAAKPDIIRAVDDKVGCGGMIMRAKAYILMMKGRINWFRPL